MKNNLYVIIFSVLFYASGLIKPVMCFGSVEINLGTDLQVCMTTNGDYYSWDLSAMALLQAGYPLLAGLRYDYQDNFQRIAVLTGVRFFPQDWPLKADLLGGGGLASIDGGPYQDAYFTFGVMPKYFFKASMIYASFFFTDIEAYGYEYDFVNTEIGIGFNIN